VDSKINCIVFCHTCNQTFDSTRQLMNVQTTLNFYGRTEEAVEFYCRTIEAETLFLMRFRDRPDYPELRPGMEEKIFHATFRIGSTEIMASDCGCENSPTETTFASFSLLLRVETPEKAERFFAALSDGGRVQIPLVETFFAARYGIVIDRFGISWKIMVPSKMQN
jgi:PhnB protein